MRRCSGASVIALERVSPKAVEIRDQTSSSSECASFDSAHALRGSWQSWQTFFEKFEGLDCITKEHHRRTVDHVAPKVSLFTVALTKVEETYL